jgi:secreted trypsin-like serine protease
MKLSTATPALLAAASLAFSVNASASLLGNPIASSLPLPLPVATGLDGLAYEASTFYFTTQASTPAGQATGYNARHRPEFGGSLSGVASLFLGGVNGSGVGCSGALLAGGMHVLTAAHCVTDANGKLDIDVATSTNLARFPIVSTGANGLGSINHPSAEVAITGITVHPGWTGDYVRGGNDIAVLTLAHAAPAAAARYELYTGGDEVGKASLKSGWGRVGVGSTGVSPFSGWRMGQNTWDMNGQDFWDGIAPANANILMYDFDNGLAANDAFRAYFGLSHLGLGDNEVLAGSGDSGGPSFIDGKIAGVTSFGITFFSNNNRECLPGNPDLVCGLNNTFGEFGGDTRVSGYTSWITAQMAAPVPEPLSGAMLLAGLGVIGSVARRRRSA